MDILKRKAAALGAAVLMAVSTAGCTGSSAGEDVSESPAETSVTEETKPNPALGEMRDIPSTELVKEMRIGWNLGNTFDAQISDPTGNESTADWETAWGQPLTTRRMIDSAAAQGFNVFRLPVTWDGKFGEGPDYKIDEEWLARVKEVADWALEDDMFVILNMHHEEWMYPDAEHAEENKEIIVSLWSQIADYFADYNERLIFEAFNEPRLRGTPMEWNGGNAESRQIINDWGSAFVETIRSKGGNNEKRHLMVPGYAASSSEAVLKDIKLPDDDKVIVSVHAYLPYAFALAEPENAKDTWSAENSADTHDIDYLMLALKDLFIDKGRAVIIGEFGMRNRFNTADRAACARYYVTRASEMGIPCVWWDNNAFVSGEAFGLLDRTTYEWRYPEIMTALMEASGR
ncbi:MAG: glycoside hydrolase family 5 protein [Oscillospiraceae bacterium]|nr:glycoside hydrolase family 5 protein [Oscillospiraceae bacterium]